MHNKTLALIICILIVSSTFIGCRGNNTDNPNNIAGNTGYSVGLVTDMGGVNDNSFNQAGDRGIKMAAEQLGITRLNPIESTQQQQYEPNLKTMAGAADLTVGTGYTMQESMKSVAAQLPEKKFMIIDAIVDAGNTVSYLFKENEGSFLAGVMAGKLTKTNKIGFVGGQESDVISRFEAGFIAGVASVNSEAAAGLMPGSATSHGKYVKYIGSFSDQGKAKEAASILYNSGVDIIFHCAGGAGEGVFKAAQEKSAYAIGVDADQAKAMPAYANVILFSMIKKVDIAVLNGIKSLTEDNFQGGSTISLGLKEEGVGISETLNSAVTEEAINLSNSAKAGIIDGTLIIPANLSELLTFEPTNLGAQ